MSDVPGFGRVDIAVRLAAELTDVVKGPEGAVCKIGVIRCGQGLNEQVALGVLDQSALLIDGDDDINGDAQRQLQNLQAADVRIRAQDLGPDQRVQGSEVDAGDGFDEDSIIAETGVWRKIELRGRGPSGDKEQTESEKKEDKPTRERSADAHTRGIFTHGNRLSVHKF